ncbi:MAG: hypothetical protein A2096_01225, partial [Spirochaetes bacterium GWF1_41_5]
TLLKHGVLHMLRLAEWSGGAPAVNEYKPKYSGLQYTELRRRIEALPGWFETTASFSVQKIEYQQACSLLDETEKSIAALQTRQTGLHKEQLKYEDLKRQLELYGDISGAVKSGTRFSFLGFLFGVLPEASMEKAKTSLRSFPAVFLSLPEKPENKTLLIIMKRDETDIRKLLAVCGWRDLEIDPALPDLKAGAITDLDLKISSLKKEKEECAGAIKNQIFSRSEILHSVWEQARAKEIYYKIQSHFGKTSHTALFAGWLPADKKNALEKDLKTACREKCWCEWHNPHDLSALEKQNVPVCFSNPRILAPFQMLVRNFSLPAYGTIDPTPLVALFYVIMFGLMFGDAGHGLVILLTGLSARFILARRTDSGMRSLSELLIWCGFGAILAGIFFGSYFGMSLFPPVWFNYHAAVSGHDSGSGFVRDIYGILKISVYFGISVISAGILLSMINKILTRNFIGFFFEKTGLLGAWMYFAGIYAAFYFVQHDYLALPPAPVLIYSLALPAFLFMFKAPLEFFLHKKHKFTVFTIIDFIMEWIVEMLEIASGFLANTLSFMRVAGLGIAHVSLMAAFFQIASMISPEGKSLYSIIILILGNILVIMLEGLSAGIQSLRLNYYEFFSKFFCGSQIAYDPIRLERSTDAKL